MKPILLLKNETLARERLVKAADTLEIPTGETEAVAGCNCDRWGHPYPGCVHRVVEAEAHFPISIRQLTTGDGEWNT